jgi:hypothetical protein
MDDTPKKIFCHMWESSHIKTVKALNIPIDYIEEGIKYYYNDDTNTSNEMSTYIWMALSSDRNILKSLLLVSLDICEDNDKPIDELIDHYLETKTVSNADAEYISEKIAKYTAEYSMCELEDSVEVNTLTQSQNFEKFLMEQKELKDRSDRIYDRENYIETNEIEPADDTIDIIDNYHTGNSLRIIRVHRDSDNIKIFSIERLNRHGITEHLTEMHESEMRTHFNRNVYNQLDMDEIDMIYDLPIQYMIFTNNCSTHMEYDNNNLDEMGIAPPRRIVPEDTVETRTVKAKNSLIAIDVDDPLACKICFEYKINTSLTCGHAIICSKCVGSIDHCPTCKASITNWNHIYLG